MSKSKNIQSNNFNGSSIESTLAHFKDRARQKLHCLKSRITQHRSSNMAKNAVNNSSLEEIATDYIKAETKISRQKFHRSQQQNIQQEQDILTEQDKIYQSFPVIAFDISKDLGKKWKIVFGKNFELPHSSDSINILACLLMFSEGYFPLSGKKQSKSKINIQLIPKLKMRPSRMITTFKCALKDGILVFSYLALKLSATQYIVCLYVNCLVHQLKIQKIEHYIDSLFQHYSFNILPGEIACESQVIQKDINLFRFDSKLFKLQSGKQDTLICKVCPCKLKKNQIELSKVNTITKFETFKTQMKKDETNYQSFKIIYQNLALKEKFDYSLSSGELEVLETAGNLIVMGRSGTGKTTCALLRLLFKELYSKKNKRNVFLTASPYLIQEIQKKYYQFKGGIYKTHNFNYSKNQNINFNQTVDKFLKKLDETYQQKKKVQKIQTQQNKTSSFMTIRQYIENVDSFLQNPFFLHHNNIQRKTKNLIDIQTICNYPDEIQWEVHVTKFRKVNQGFQAPQSQQAVYQLNYDLFTKRFWQLPNIKRLSGSLSPQIVWSQIFTTIKGSSRAHSFFYKFLDFQTYRKQSKNQYLTDDQKKNVYDIFKIYEKVKQQSKQYDLNDIVNHILIELSKKQYANIRISSLFVDQVQDFPPSFIFLTGKVVEQSLFFSGDTAQTIAKGVRFSFNDIKGQFQNRYFQNSFALQKPQIKKLYENFRSQNQIIQLSNSLIRVLQLMFPSSIDKIPFQVSPYHGMKPIILRSSQTSIVSEYLKQNSSQFINSQKNMFGADKAIIVRNLKDKQKIPDQLKNMTCLTFQQCKGLQYQVVILYNYFSQKQVQWSFLKHIQLEYNRGVRELGFDKKKLGSNIKLYFDLCTQIKILYTIVTRPKSILFIIDDKIPQQLTRIWDYLNLTTTISSLQSLKTYQQLIIDKIDSDKDRQNPQKGNILRSNKIDRFKNIFQNKKQFSIQTYYEQWIRQGFKLFFQRKNYSQAKKCFSNIKLDILSEICQAYQFADKAANQIKDQQKKKKLYNDAAEIFQCHDRKFQAAKCNYLAGQYFRSLKYYKLLGIKKYQAQCHWKLFEYMIATQIFFKQRNFYKGFKVLIQSCYWHCFFVSITKYSSQIYSKNKILVQEGLQKAGLNILKSFDAYFVENNNMKKVSKLQQLLSRSYDEYNKNIKIQLKQYLHNKHKQVISTQSQCISQDKQAAKYYLKQLRENGQLYGEILNRNSLFQNATDFIAVIMILFQFLIKYTQMKQYAKYARDNIKFSQSIKDDLRILLRKVFTVLEKYDQIKLIISISKKLQFRKIQQLVFIQNFLKINKSLKNYQERCEIHNYGVSQIQDQTEAKISILLFIFGKVKQVGHFFQDEDNILSLYLKNYKLLSQNFCQDITISNIKIPYIKKQYSLCQFGKNIYEDYNNRRVLKTIKYSQILHLLDNISPVSYFADCFKEKQYINIYSSKSKDQQLFIKKLAIQKANQYQSKEKQIIGKLKKYKQKKQQQRIIQFKKSLNTQQQAKKQKVKYIPQIKIYFKQRNQSQQEFQMWKIDFGKGLLQEEKMIKQQRNRELERLKKQKNRFKEKQQQKINILDQIYNCQYMVQTSLQQIQIANDQKPKFQKSKTIQQQKMVDINQQMEQIRSIIQSLQQQQTIYKKQLANKKSQQQQQNYYYQRNDQYYSKKESQQMNKNLQQLEINKNKQVELINKRISINDKIQKLNKQIKLQQNKIKALNQKYRNNLKLIQQKHKILNQIHLLDLYFKDGVYDFSNQQKILDKLQIIIKKNVEKIYKKYYQMENQMKDKYKPILSTLKVYNHLDSQVPRQCLNFRQYLNNQIKSITQQIQLSQQVTRIQKDKLFARTTDQLSQKLYQKKVKQQRQNIFFKILNKKYKHMNLKKYISYDLDNVLKIITKYTDQSQSEISQQQKKQNSKIVDQLLYYQINQQKILLLIYYTFQIEQFIGLKNIIDNQVFQQLSNDLSDFILTIMKSKQGDQIALKILSIFGVQTIEPHQNHIKYLQGFSIINKNHNLFAQIRQSFYFKISQQYMIVRTIDALIAFKLQIKNLITKKKPLFSFIDKQCDKKINQYKNQVVKFNFRKKESFEKQKVLLCQDLNESIDYCTQNLTKDDIKQTEIYNLRVNTYDVKAILLAQIINIQQNNNLDYQKRSQLICVSLQKYIKISKFQQKLRQIQINNKKVKNNKNYCEKDTLNNTCTTNTSLKTMSAQEIKQDLIQQIHKIILMINPAIQQQPKMQKSQIKEGQLSIVEQQRKMNKQKLKEQQQAQMWMKQMKELKKKEQSKKKRLKKLYQKCGFTYKNDSHDQMQQDYDIEENELNKIQIDYEMMDDYQPDYYEPQQYEQEVDYNAHHMSHTMHMYEQEDF